MLFDYFISFHFFFIKMSREWKQDPYIPDAFQKRFGHIVYAIAESLGWFSMDLIGLILSYNLHNVVQKDRVPVSYLMNCFHKSQKDPVKYCDLMFHPLYQTIWLILDETNKVLDMDGNELLDIPCISTKDSLSRPMCYHSCGFYKDQVFFTTIHKTELHVFNAHSGQFIQKLLLKTNNVPFVSFGIRIFDDKIIISQRWQLSIFNHQGELLISNKVEDGMGSLHISQDDEIFTTLPGYRYIDSCIAVMDINGKFKRNMGPMIHHPFHLTVDRDNHFIICDSSLHRIYVLDEQGNSITTFTTSTHYPMSACVDSEGKYWVATRRALEIYTW